MKRILDYISVFLFFAFTVMFAVSTVFFQSSESEKNISEDRTLKGQIQGCVYSRFPLKSNFKALYSSVLIGTGQNRLGKVYVDNDRLIEVFDRTDSEKIQKSVAAINRFREAHKDASVYAMLVPTASGIYKSQLPSFASAVDQQKLIDDIYYRLDNSILTLDAFNPLFSARDDYIYFRTDSRWTSFGAYAVYRSVISKLGFQPVDLSNYDIEYADRSFYGNLYKKTFYGGVSADTVNIFRNKRGSYVTGTEGYKDEQKVTSKSVYYDSALQSDDKYGIFLNGDTYKKYTVSTSVSSGPELLIIKGSYANCMVPLLTPHYSSITLVDLGKLDGEALGDVVDIDGFDQIMFLYDIRQFCAYDKFDLLNERG
ncbi:DHHW family protein [Ruminococcus sp. Marseille-P6503]|uniref:DHHW family protein n=1 Tax=Ruminococcus sp. Marseille-P6503 TaxID=2364796 RepID=UPI000F549410|nr:DHHW family protein [Ruminococcus sp. Marseille-P6503]